jgi:FtsP/CotA-like multicopper oxidase with cupredoxin domain
LNRIRVNRRSLLQAGGAALAALPLARCGLANAAQPSARLDFLHSADGIVDLAARERRVTIGAGGTSPAWTYGDHLFPALRAKRGQTVAAQLANHLSQHTSIHWHGVRLTNAMDGVPYLTQAPVQPGESFTYTFTPPDAGTFFFHPHCNTAEQLGRGLAGVLIVDGDTEEDERWDDDIVCVIKDWRIGPDGKFLPFVTLDGAARAGTFGTVRTVNGLVAPTIPALAGANIRVRLINVDNTRICNIGVEGLAEGSSASVIAIDGNPVTPSKLEGWRLGPAMRLDIAIRGYEGSQVRIVDYFAADPVTLVTLDLPGHRKRSRAPDPPRLKPASLPEPDLARARRHQLTLSASAAASQYPNIAPIVLPDGRRINLADSLCLSQRTLWALDGKAWPEQGHRNLPPPLLEFRRGEHVVIEFHNTTPHPHPMHLHGHTMKVLQCSRLARGVHWADTVLVMPNERVTVAFVADNPGNWMIHCHIIEHQDTGMMAWFKVA